MDAVYDTGYSQLEEVEEVAEERVDAHSVAEDYVGALCQTGTVVSAQLLPRRLFFLLLQRHPRDQIQTAKHNADLRKTVDHHRGELNFNQFMKVAPVFALQLTSKLHDLEVLRFFFVQKAVPKSSECIYPVIGSLDSQSEVELHHYMSLKI